jgi:hypothetical protein
MGPLGRLAEWVAAERRLRRAQRARLAVSSVTVERATAGDIVYRMVVRNHDDRRARDVVLHLTAAGALLAKTERLTLDPGQEFAATLVSPAPVSGPATLGIDVGDLGLMRTKVPAPASDWRVAAKLAAEPREERSRDGRGSAP